MFELIFTLAIYYGIFESGRYVQKNNLDLNKIIAIIGAITDAIKTKITSK